MDRKEDKINTIHLSKTIMLTNVIRTKGKCFIYYQNLPLKIKDEGTIIVTIVKTSTKTKVLT